MMRSSAEVFGITWAMTLLTLGAIRHALAFNFVDDSVEVFEDPTRDRGRGSYFGFSVGLQRQEKDWSYRLLVGAPRANSTTGKYDPKVITEPGAVFSCNLSNLLEECKEVVVDPTGNSLVSGSSETAYQDRKNFGWLGGAMDVQPNRIQATAVCAPRWKNQRPSNLYLMNGACYWFNSSHADDTAVKLLPLNPRSKQVYVVSKYISVFYYAHGQAGISVHFPNADGELILGAPGVFNWRGTVIRAKDYNAEGPGGNSRRRRRDAADLRRSSPRRQVGSDLHEDDLFSDFLVPNPYNTEDIVDFSLFGYSVTSGRFWKTSLTHYVAGAPRGANGLGQAFIFLFPLHESYPYNIFAEYRGEQLGEYFGASVAAPDLTGDSYDELVVGAPLYALENSPDVGRIYVYVNRRGSFYLTNTRYTGSEVAGARFGTTLMAPGDLNYDGYGDLLVGAPFENEGEGAVYVYYGSSEGLRPTFSQRLSPSTMSSSSSSGVRAAPSSLRGFGMSISRGADIDDNGYPDVAIGSHESGHAVIIRTRSVARLGGRLDFSPTRLSLEDKEFTVKACLIYTGYQAPDTQELSIRLTLDAGLPIQRAFFESGGSSITYSDTFTKDATACKDHRAIVADALSDYRQAIQVRLEYRLASEGPFEERKGGPGALRTRPLSHTRAKRQLRPVAPKPPRPAPQAISTLPRLENAVTDPEHPSSTMDRISFVTGCEDDGDPSCVSDMVVNATFTFKGYPTFEIGSPQSVNLHLVVSNLGEPAFLPNLTVVVPHPVDLVEPTSHSCIRYQDDMTVALTCDLPGPLKSDTTENVDVVLDMSGLTDDSPPSLEILVKVLSASESEKNYEDNLRTLTLNLAATADLRMHGAAEEEQVVYSRLDADTINTTDLLITTHTVTVVKRGPTPLKEVILEVKIPVNISSREAGNHNFAQVFINEALLERQPFQCQLEGASLAHDSSEDNIQTGISGVDYDLAGTGEEPSDLAGDKEAGTRRRRRSEDGVGVKAFEKQNYGEVEEEEKKKVVIWSGWRRVSWALMKCHILGWPMGAKVAKLTFSTRLNMTVLGRVMSASKGADFVTTVEARVNVSNPALPFVGSQKVSGNITTRLVPGLLPGESVPWWIILLAVLAGLLLLFLLMFGLYKLGFFRRKEQEEMQEHKANLAKNEYGATDNAGSEE